MTKFTVLFEAQEIGDFVLDDKHLNKLETFRSMAPIYDGHLVIRSIKVAI